MNVDDVELLLRYQKTTTGRLKFAAAIINPIKNQISKLSLARKLLNTYNLVAGQLSPVIFENSLYLGEECTIRTSSCARQYLPEFEINYSYFIPFNIRYNCKCLHNLLQIDNEISKNIAKTESDSCEKILHAFYQSTNEINSCNIHDLVNYRYIFCNNSTIYGQLLLSNNRLMTIIRSNFVEPEIIFAISDLDGIIIDRRLEPEVLLTDNPAETLLGYTYAETIGMMIKRPTECVKFVDKDIYEQTHTNKFKWMVHS